MRNRTPSQEEISSTERLLDVIRGEEPSPGKIRKVSVAPPRPAGRKAFAGKAIRVSRKTTLGVDVGRTHLRMIKAAQVSDTRWKMLDYRAVPFEPALRKDAAAFADFLRAAVLDFGGARSKFQLWSIVSSGNVEVRHIRIPKVARKLIHNTVYWTVKKESNFDDKDTIFDFEVQGEVVEKGINKIPVLTYLTPRHDVAEAKELFQKAGLKLAGLTIAPFAIQNLFRTGWMPHAEKAVAALYIGNDFSRIDIFFEGNLVLTRGIKSGVSSMVESLMESFNEENALVLEDSSEGVVLSSAGGGDFGGGSRVMESRDARELLFSFFTGEPQAPGPEQASFQMSEDDVFQMISPAIERLVRQVERTLEHYTGILGNESVSRIYISGLTGVWKLPANCIGEQLGIGHDIFDPIAPGLLMRDGVTPPDDLGDRTPFGLSLGLALCDDSRTPNLLFTYKAREEKAAVLRLNRGIFLVFAAVMSVLLVLFGWLEHMAGVKRAELASLRQTLEQYSPFPDQNLIAQMVVKAKKRQQELKEWTGNFAGLAVIGELTRLTPQNIRLVSVNAGFGTKSEEKPVPPGKQPAAEDKEKNRNTGRTLVVDGIVRGERQTLEAALAGYLMKLGASPLFTNPSVHSSNLETYQEEGEVLHFVLHMGIQ